jgi:hypothetical protein
LNHRSSGENKMKLYVPLVNYFHEIYW